MGDLRLTEIWIYPVKSLGGIRVRSSRVLEKGLLFDRRWMLVDADGQFITQRTDSRLARFKMEFAPEGFLIRYGDEQLLLPFLAVTGIAFPARIFDDTVIVQEAGNLFSKWFSSKLEQTCRLVHFPEQNQRPVNTSYAHRGEHVSLADGFPFLIIGEASLEDLNHRLKEPLPMNRFRPNLVFSGGTPFEEDTWKQFTIGKNRFAGVKPCGRCVVTTINQETTEKGVEPLATLAAYRRRGSSVYFGQNLIAIDHEEITEGDEIVLG